eukprot:9080387-Ditylum_brightwellii.AAC.1
MQRERIPMTMMIATSKLALAQQKQNIHSTTCLFHYVNPTSLFYQSNNKCHHASMPDTGNYVKADLDNYTNFLCLWCNELFFEKADLKFYVMHNAQ